MAEDEEYTEIPIQISSLWLNWEKKWHSQTSIQ